MGAGQPLPLSQQEMQAAREAIKRDFGSLHDAFQVTSWPTDSYNCIAWAAEDTCYWWWPDPDGEAFWPHGIERQDSITAFIAAFQTIGYEPCDSYTLEAGFEKVALYVVAGRVKHMARQLPSGSWTSKLGGWWDIAHDSVDGVQDHPDRPIPHYGVKMQALRRRPLAQPPVPHA